MKYINGIYIYIACYAENDTSAVCQQRKLSPQRSHQHSKYCLHSAGYLGPGQCLNAKCGQADASTSSEIRNESRHQPTSNPRGQVQIHCGPTLIKPPASPAARKENFNHNHCRRLVKQFICDFIIDCIDETDLACVAESLPKHLVWT